MNLLDALAPTEILPYILLGLATFAEGPFTLLAAGAGIALGRLLPLPAFLAIVSGNLAADLGWYSLGRFGKMEWVERACQRLRIDPRGLRRLGRAIRQHAARLIFLSKFTVGLPIPTLIAVGLQRVPARRWIAFLMLGELLKSALLLGVGYLLSEGIQQTYGAVRAALWALTILIAGGAALYFKLRKKSTSAPLTG